MSANVRFEGLPYDMHRTIVDFTDPGFEPLKRVNKMFYDFERMPHRVEAVAEEAKKRCKEAGISIKISAMSSRWSPM